MVCPEPPLSDEEAEASSPDAEPDPPPDDDEPEDLGRATASGDGASPFVGWARAWSSSPSANG
jgi:hypothetical protein